jgi:hypothetical protein
VDTLLKNRTAANFIGQCRVRCLTAIPEEGAPAAKKRKTSKKTDTCEWVGPIETLNAHMQECAYVHIACIHAGCDWTGLRSSRAEHAAVCLLRREACPYCTTDVPVGVMDTHKQMLCNRRPILCRNVGCAVRTAYVDEVQHLKVCPRGMTTCPYSATLGCAFRCARNSMPAHAGDASAHFAGLMRALKSSQQTVAQLQLKSETLQLENAEIKRELERVDGNSNWNHGLLGPIRISPTKTTLASYVGEKHKQMIGGMRWEQEILVTDGKLWAILNLDKGKGCPFEITYTLISGEGNGTGDPINITKTLTGTMGEEETAGGNKWRKGVILDTVSHLDHWHNAKYPLTLLGTIKFKIASR